MTKQESKQIAVSGAVRIAVLVAVCAPIVAFSQSQTFELDIPSKDLSEALREFAGKARQQVVFNGETVRGERSSAIKGSYAPQDALRLMLADTRLTAEVGRGGIFKVAQTNRVQAQESVPTAAESKPAAATASAAERVAAEPVEVVIVTGTRRMDLTETQSAVPIDVFSAETLATQPSGDMNAILTNLIPSFNVDRSGFDGSAFVRGPTLRGLPPDETLVLVNGKRRHRSALVQLGGSALAVGSQGPDLSQIPAIAIERIEVLRDGAAAQYGSDAIAGVINYGLRSNRDGAQINTRYGQYFAGDGGDTQIAGNLGLPLGQEGFLNLSGEYLRAQQAVRSVQRPDAAVLTAMGYDMRDPVQRSSATPEVDAVRLFVNGGIPLGGVAGELYFFGNYSDAKSSGDFNFRRPITVTVPNGPAGEPVVFGQSVRPVYLDRITAIDPRPCSPTVTTCGQLVSFWDANGATFETSDVFPNGFTPRFTADISDLSTVVGYKGKTQFGLSYDISGSFGQSRVEYTLGNTLNPSLGPDSPTAFDIGELKQEDNNVNIDISYPVEIGLASPLHIAAGAEYRRESYLIGAGEQAGYRIGQYAYQEVYDASEDTVSIVTHSIGSNGFPGYGPDSATDRSRDSYAVYLDLETDITNAFTLGVAGRAEEFSDFGSTINGKVAARYAMSPAFAVRAAGSTGFRAPTPGQLFTQIYATTFISGNPVPIAEATLPPDAAAARYYGATRLEPEESTNVSAGFVFTPNGQLTATLDYYQIDVRNRIGITGGIPVLGDLDGEERQALLALGVPDWATLNRVRYFTNGFETRTRGVDLVASYRAPSSFGTFTTSLALNYNENKLLSRDLTVTQNGRTFTFIDDERLGDIENVAPQWRANLTQTWTYQGLSVNARARYFGETIDFDRGGNLPIGSDILVDLEIAYTLADKYRIAIGAENLFDSYPDKDTRDLYPLTGGTARGDVYSLTAPGGFVGGFMYLRFGVDF